jgi:hypothetical protein
MPIYARELCPVGERSSRFPGAQDVSDQIVVAFINAERISSDYALHLQEGATMLKANFTYTRKRFGVSHWIGAHAMHCSAGSFAKEPPNPLKWGFAISVQFFKHNDM